jgi:hypothetical protein
MSHSHHQVAKSAPQMEEQKRGIPAAKSAPRSQGIGSEQDADEELSLLPHASGRGGHCPAAWTGCRPLPESAYLYQIIRSYTGYKKLVVVLVGGAMWRGGGRFAQVVRVLSSHTTIVSRLLMK